jgi:rod shape-determining protein MreD
MEWLNVTMIMTAMFMGYGIILSVMMVEASPWRLTATHALLTITVYPIIVLVSQLLFGVRKLAPGDIDGMEARI